MNTLRETLRQRRAAELPHGRSSESAETPVRTLQIHSWDGEKWVFPWSHFSAARHQGTGESEQLVLSFAKHEVILDGTRLALLLSDVASFQLDCLREMPTKFRAQVSQTEPFVARISVRSLTNAMTRQGSSIEPSARDSPV